MTLYRAKSLIEFDCDWCHNFLDTGTDNFQDAVAILQREGWTALPPGDDPDWTHRCPKCRFPKEAA